MNELANQVQTNGYAVMCEKIKQNLYILFLFGNITKLYAIKHDLI